MGITHKSLKIITLYLVVSSPSNDLSPREIRLKPLYPTRRLCLKVDQN